MLSPQFILPLDDEILVDLFAGGGGVSTGIERATKRHVDLAINHNADALSLHQANHPQTEHLIADVREVCPRKATRGRPVGLLHLSPDCTHHSQAKGGQPRDAKLRALSWIGLRWVGQARPRILTLENVKAIVKWGPLIAKRCNRTGRVVKLDGTVAAPGERVPVQNQFLVPDKRHEGRSWRRFVRTLQAFGYEVDVTTLCAADHNTPTTRERLFLAARRDGVPITWATPTHHKVANTPGQKKWRPASECIDWSIESKSIFGRKKPLVEATLRRIGHGMWKYVVTSGDPFIVPIANWSRESIDSIHDPVRTVTAWPKGGSLSVITPVMIQAGHGDGKPDGVKRWGSGSRDVRMPVGTVTASGGGQAMAAATMVQMGYGEREGQAPRSLDIEQPLGTVVAGGLKHGLVTACMLQANGGFNNAHCHDIRRPVTTVTKTGSQQQLITAQLVEYHLSNEEKEGALRCAEFMSRYHGSDGQWDHLRDPQASIEDRLALVTVWIKGVPWVIVDICLRMLTPRELYNANGFPKDYVIDRGHDGRIFSKRVQVKMVGNSVPPTLAEAMVAALWHAQAPERMAA
jgi:DNA (cytosine-5)-methyltransferase 1